jgi:PAS domain S-box-containing protein
MFKYFYNKRLLSLRRRIKELETKLKSVDEKNAISAIYSKKAMLEQEGLFKLLLDNVDEIVTLFSSSNLIVFISPSCYTHLGYLPEEMEGKHSLTFVHPDDHAMMTELIKQNDSGNTLPLQKHRLVHKNGSVIWVESHWKPIYLEYNGQQTHAVYSTRILDLNNK